MNATHTPGPWRVGDHPQDGSGTHWRAVVTDALPFAPSFVCSALGEDARLIAAAPELADALREIDRWMAQADLLNGRPRHRRIRALLARLDGAA